VRENVLCVARHHLVDAATLTEEAWILHIVNGLNSSAHNLRKISVTLLGLLPLPTLASHAATVMRMLGD
jgi:hypothetical protein